MRKSFRLMFRRVGGLAIPLGYFAKSYQATECDLDEHCYVNFEKDQILSNWSSTHTMNVERVYEPTNESELVRLLTYHQDIRRKIRPIGTLLSPNGIALPDPNSSALSMIHFDDISVNLHDMTVTVGAGATVKNVLSALSTHGLTLENFSSIQEQQIAGWTQVAAHGTGCSLSTVEEQIIEMKIATPAEGLLTLSDTHLPEIYRWARVGLGSVGVVTQITLRCIPQLHLHEKTTTMKRDDISDGHYDRLRQCRHVRYMWIPYTPCVVAVTSNPVVSSHTPPPRRTSTHSSSKLSTSDQSAPTQALMNMILTQVRQTRSPSSPSLEASPAFLRSQSVAQLRDIALGYDPLNLQVPLLLDMSPYKCNYEHSPPPSLPAVL